MTDKNQASEALENLDLEFVLGNEGLDYKIGWGRSGRQINVKTCPFCGNSKWKVYINADTGLGNCFAGSCGQSTFNKWSFLREHFQDSIPEFRARVIRLAEDQGWRPAVKPIKHDPGPLFFPGNTVRVNDMVAMPKYLLERGMTAELAEYFDLRYCDDGKFTAKMPKGDDLTQSYSKRVIIPIYDRKGALVSFQGRDVTGEAEKRYIFPPMFSSTGSHLYNINNWQPGMTKAVLCEGPFDVIGTKRALDHSGARDTLPMGTFGMHFSVSDVGQPDQMDKLMALKREGLQEVTFLWDNENPAICRAIDAAEKINRYGLTAKVAILEGAKDPGEATPQQIMDALKKARPINNALQAMMLKRKYSH